MLKKREVSNIGFTFVLMSLIIASRDFKITLNSISQGLIYSAIILAAVILAQNLMARERDIVIEHSLWKMWRYGIYKRMHTQSPIPMGAILPILLSFFSMGLIKCFTFLQFDAIKTLPGKIAKRIGKYRFTGIMEWDLALIGFFGICAALLISLISNFLGAEPLARYAVYYAIANIIPFGQLDGSRIFFGSIPLYTTTLVLTSLSTIITIVF